MKRVLVTGADGFVGRHLVPELAGLGFTVIPAAGPAAGPGAAGDVPGLLRADLLSPGAARDLVRRARPTHLVHLAWHTDPADYRESPRNADWAEASRTLALAFAGAGGQRALFAGSCYEYEWGPGPLREQASPCRPATPYGAAKLALFREISSLYGVSGPGFAWARLFFLFGPGERPEKLVPSAIRLMAEKSPVPLPGGNLVRDYLYIKDAASALARLLAGPAQGPVNVASGEPVRLGELVSEIARAMGVAPDLRPGGYEAAGAAAAPGVVADVGRLREELGWRPRFSLREALAATVLFWREKRGE